VHNSAKSRGTALKLSDTQLVLLSAAAQRDDHCLTATPNLKGGAVSPAAMRWRMRMRAPAGRCSAMRASPRFEQRLSRSTLDKARRT
jgi:hypothetical protein